MTETAAAGVPAVATSRLRKTYRSVRGTVVAVEGLDLEVPAGGVHGFLGPNGSGKTTTIRMVLGLIRPDSGAVSVFGHAVPERLPDVIGRIGAIVEQPKFFPTFSGRLNLELLARAIDVPTSRVDEVLEEVGLTDRARHNFRTYSLGMKQRLAIAATLLKDPELLIFDEPTNGLDPAGIREVRETMRALGQRGKTVLVSSHVLAEVQQVADTVSIIARGRLLASGRVEDVTGAVAGRSVLVRAAELGRAAELLATAGLEVRPEGDVLYVDGVTDPALITRTLAGHGIYLSELSPVAVNLEAAFLELTAGLGPQTEVREDLLGEPSGQPDAPSGQPGTPTEGS